MLFASSALAARIERAECRLVTDGTEAVSRNRPDVDTLVLPIAGGVATIAGPDSPLNKVAGIGFDGSVDEGELTVLEAECEGRGVPVRIELSILADPSIAPMLTGRGYALEGFENVLGRSLPLADPKPVNDEIAVALSGADTLETWLDIVITGFAHPDAQGVESHESYPRDVIENIMRDMAGAQGFVRYLAEIDSEPVGGASMRTFEGVAQLCGAATIPSRRCRGVQSALLTRRLLDAGADGCDVAVVTTQPGSKSEENVQRQGFELLYTRAVLVRTWDA